MNGQHFCDLLILDQLFVHLRFGASIDLGACDVDIFDELVSIDGFLEHVHFIVGESGIVSKVDPLDLWEEFEKLC